MCKRLFSLLRLNGGSENNIPKCESLLFLLGNNRVVSFDGLPVHAHSRVISATAFLMVVGMKALLCFVRTKALTAEDA